MGPGPRDPGRPSKFKSGTPGPPSKFKVGSQDPPQSLKVGPPYLRLVNTIFSEYFILFFTYLFLCLFLIRYQKISTVSNRNQ